LNLQSDAHSRLGFALGGGSRCKDKWVSCLSLHDGLGHGHPFMIFQSLSRKVDYRALIHDHIKCPYLDQTGLKCPNMDHDASVI